MPVKQKRKSSMNEKECFSTSSRLRDTFNKLCQDSFKTKPIKTSNTIKGRPADGNVVFFEENTDRSVQWFLVQYSHFYNNIFTFASTIY